jgi:ATP-binding cassette subfamily C protein
LVVLMILGALIEVVGVGIIPIYVLLLLDPAKVAELPVVGSWFANTESLSNQTIVLYGGIVLLIVFLIKSLFLTYLYYQKGKIMFDAKVNLENNLFKTYIFSPYSFHVLNNSATLLRNLTQEIPVIITGVVFPLLTLINGSFMVLSILALLLATNPLITLVVIVLIGGSSGLFFKIIHKKIGQYGLEAQQQRAVVIRTTNHMLGGIKELSVFNTKQFFMDEFYASTRISARASMYRQFVGLINKPILEMIAILGVIVITYGLFFGGQDAAGIAATLTLFATAIVRLMPAAREIVSGYSGVKYSYVAVNPVYEHIFNFNENLKKNRNQSFGKPALAFNNKIKLNDIHFRYPETKDWVLKGISVEIVKNSVFGIVGTTGGGKTTLIDILMGLLEVQQGEIVVDDRNIYENLDSWKSKIGYVPQFIFLTDDTIKRNIAFGIDDRDIDNVKLEKAIMAAQLQTFIQKLPDKENTVIGERGVRLSGGQRQRIGIARALYNDPELLIFDEATSSLDNVTEKNLVKAIDQFKNQKTIIIIAHRITTVKKCDVIIFLKNGVISDMGNYDELLERNPDFQNLAMA